MHKFSDQLLGKAAILLLAAWTLFCCCEKRQMASWVLPQLAVGTADAQSSSPHTVDLPACCRSCDGVVRDIATNSCPTNPLVSDEAPCQSPQPDDDADHPRGCCAACCIKHLKAATALKLAVDTVGNELPLALCDAPLQRSRSRVEQCVVPQLGQPPPSRPSTLVVSARWRV